MKVACPRIDTALAPTMVVVVVSVVVEVEIRGRDVVSYPYIDIYTD